MPCTLHYPESSLLFCFFPCLIHTLSPLLLPFKSFYLSSFHSLYSQVPLSENVYTGTRLSLFLYYSYCFPFIEPNLFLFSIPVSLNSLSVLCRIQPFSNPSYHCAAPFICPSSLSQPLITRLTSSSQRPPLSDPCLSLPSLLCPSLLLHGHPSTPPSFQTSIATSPPLLGGGLQLNIN